LGVSACLAGEICRYDGKYTGIKAVEKLVALGKAFSFCPEMEGGLLTPREPAEIQKGDGIDVWNKKSRILTLSGKDVTEEFKNGAHNVLNILQKKKITAVILKEKSPSCASCTIYDGTFSKIKKEGVGITTALLLQNNIMVYSDEKVEYELTEHNGAQK